MKLILPTQPTPQSIALLSDMICFAICHPTQYACLLDHLGDYVTDSDSISVNIESWFQARTLALDSPKFCSLLISRSDLIQLGIDPSLLAKWLQDLSKTTRTFPKVNLNQIIRSSLLHSDVDKTASPTNSSLTNITSSDLHFGILTLIQSNRCHDLTNQFLIDIVANLVHRSELDAEDESRRLLTQKLVDRFAQILSVAAATKVVSITNALRTSLKKLDNNQIIAALIKWQNK